VRQSETGVEVISLACKGPVVVRSVFKVLEQPTLNPSEGSNCTFTVLDSMGMANDLSTSPVVRCELELPSTGGTEEQRALVAREGTCWVCGFCPKKGCPNQIGRWYSDSCTTVARGCDINEQEGYTAQRTGIEISLLTKLMLAKFEVCSSAECFNPAAEQAKQRAARACVQGKCA
jgi:NAD-dependent dihydropyrimidine dehydrogenase PreA subunit